MKARVPKPVASVSRRARPKSVTYANVMSTAAAVLALASTATSKPVRKSIRRLRKRRRRDR